MAQAERITTAIRELMSHGWPLKSTSLVRAAHTEFVAVNAGPIRSEKALEGRADHLQKVFAALHVYLTAIITEIAEKIPRRYLDHLFQQFDALGVIRNAAAEIRVHENWRVS